MRTHIKKKSFKWLIRICIASALVIVIAGTVWYLNNRVICRNCNVILVSIDTLSALHLPCYGYARDTAPNLCHFARNNVQFLNAYSQAPMTLPSHFSMFTSLYPHEHGMNDGNGTVPLEENFPTLAQVLQGEGYSTIFNGPTFDNHLPLNRGIERGFSTIENRKDGLTDIENWEVSLERFLKNSKQNQPTFLFLHTYAVHDPYMVRSDRERLFTDDQSKFPSIAWNYKEYYRFSKEFFIFCSQTIHNKSKRGWPYAKEDLLKTNEMVKVVDSMERSIEIYNSLPQIMQLDCWRDWYISKVDQNNLEQREYIKALYDEEIYDMDQQLASLFTFLKENDLEKNTVLIVTADHGEEFWEHGVWGHSDNVYGTSVRVPLIISAPGLSSKIITDIVESIDIYPTVLRLIGASPISTISGMDLTGKIYGAKVEFEKDFRLSEWQSVAGFTKGKWGMYSSGERPIELFDIQSDPLEQKSVIKNNNSITEQLMKSLKGIYSN